MFNLMAVSYTHLDVYKRQHLYLKMVIKDKNNQYITYMNMLSLQDYPVPVPPLLLLVMALALVSSVVVSHQQSQTSAVCQVLPCVL